MNRYLCLGILALLAGVGVVSGCGQAATPGVKITPTATSPAAIPSPTAVSLSVELGTGLAGSGPNVTIINPATSFKSSNTFAFVIHLRSPINTTKIACIIFDSMGNIAWEWEVATQPSDMVLASSTPALGSVLEKYTTGSLPDVTSVTPPLGTYVLQVFPYPSSPLNYANNIIFTYKG